MMEQPTFVDVSYVTQDSGGPVGTYFWKRMDGLIPWQRLEERIRPYYPKAGRGRQPYDFVGDAKTSLRSRCSTISAILGWRTCSTRRSRCGGSWDCGCRRRCQTRAQYCTSVISLEKRELGEGLLEEIKGYLESRGLRRLREGNIVDATIIEAPSSTKNRAVERDPCRCASYPRRGF